MELDYFPDEIDYAARVAKGVALLDEKFPDWWKLLNINTLDVANGENCVTAQSAQILEVGYGWREGMEHFGLNNDSNDVNANTYIAHGFNAEDVPNAYCDTVVQEGWGLYSQDDAFDHLNNLWRKIVTERRSALNIAL